MATGNLRDEAELAAGFASWFTSAYPDRPNARVARLQRPAAGWSNETVVLTCRWDGADRDEQLVLRMPPRAPSYPDDALAAQAAVHETLRDSGVPAPRVLALESDPSWLGAPFLVLEFVAGHVPGQAPGLDPWIVDAPDAMQRRVQDSFLGALAQVHRVRWHTSSLAQLLRRGVHAEIAYWTNYVEWSTDGHPPRALVDALAWCRTTMPADEPEAALLWGDARLGNVMYDADRRVVALLDWELASLGPAEMDLAWYLALDELTTKATGAGVPGFRSREQFIAGYESQLGRRVVDLAWHQIFALVRSIAVNDKQARLAHAAGVEYPGMFGDDNPMLGYVGRKIERFRDAP